MKFSDIETFLTIVETGSFTKAADKLFLSQSTVSHQLKTLEEDLGVTLLSRQKGQRDIVLTPKGEQFLILAKRWIDLWNEMQALSDSKDQPTLTIGAPRNLFSYTLPPLLNELKQLRPLRLKIMSYRSSEVYAAVERKEVDVGFAFEQSSQSSSVISEVLFSEKMCLIRLLQNYPSGRTVRLKDLDPKNEIYFNWFSGYQRWHEACWGVNSDNYIEINTSALLPIIMSDPKYWMIAPISIAKFFQRSMPIEIIDLATPPPDRQCYKLTNRNPRMQNITSLEIIDGVIGRLCADLPWLH